MVDLHALLRAEVAASAYLLVKFAASWRQWTEPTVRVAYADPPYPGCAHLYEDHPDYAGEVDHLELLNDLEFYDGWLLHTSSPALPEICRLLRDYDFTGYRIMAWVKPFAAFKKNVPVAYAWEPVIVKPCRKPVVTEAMVMRDWIAEPITLQRGLTGVKPDAVCRWAFHVLGMEPDDELVDLFPGTGAVTRAWESWRGAQGFDFGPENLADRIEEVRQAAEPRLSWK